MYVCVCVIIICLSLCVILICLSVCMCDYNMSVYVCVYRDTRGYGLTYMGESGRESAVKPFRSEAICEECVEDKLAGVSGEIGVTGVMG